MSLLNFIFQIKKRKMVEICSRRNDGKINDMAKLRKARGSR